ncbi:hypothetical protein PTSG_07984 [Salpingoeca rosetta]|uniref:Beta-1,4-galactosyltransferase 7 n=1 Tax=Salpingoeca rosetta (strain ATCC 50818 / BSB-021) TaxID=946362 RepID=F2UGX2_SALR5|nr:uncharacterized protein PTSG_07984 [Salpingoeca rosetta]EGD75872.1 hypothetical protein PTSG_07984 [Salpingoeca rosetta]|eukprot:XP_004991793.1 hypothetical protein PTSG_07984 [Salpingoeca rosetta]
MRVPLGRVVVVAVLLCAMLALATFTRFIKSDCAQQMQLAVHDKDDELTMAAQNLNIALEAKASLGEEVVRLTSQLQQSQQKNQQLEAQMQELMKLQRRLAEDKREKLQQQNPPPWNAVAAANSQPSPNDHKLALVIPYRNARKELEQFVPHIKTFLDKQSVPFEVIVVEQVDDYRFNRGLLANIGHLKGVERGCDYMALHDVDLLPLNDNLDYHFPSTPRHISAPWLHPNYHYNTFIGGILLMSMAHFRLVDGLSTRFWGWGREDDELYKRIVEKKLQIERPPKDIGTDTTNTFLHLHDDAYRPRDMMKIGNQYSDGKQRDTHSGLSTTLGLFDLKSERDVDIDGVTIHMFSVALHCNEEDTPWCVTPQDCLHGYYKQFIKDDPQHRWVCKRCAINCWRGFVLVGHCTETDTPVCKKIGRDISEEEAAEWPEGTIIPPKQR